MTGLSLSGALGEGGVILPHSPRLPPFVERGRSWAHSEATRRSMRACVSAGTAPERALRSAVHRRGLRYRVNARPLPDLRRTADLVFCRSCVAVFLDGCFFHGCPQHFAPPRTNREYWLAKIEYNRQRDSCVDGVLRDRGWLALRVWEHEDVDSAAERVAGAVHERANTGGARDHKPRVNVNLT